MTITRIRTETGEALRALLRSANSSQNALASSIGASQPYVNQWMTGARVPNPKWLDTIATAMNLTKKQRVELHRRAARDAGFKIDL